MLSRSMDTLKKNPILLLLYLFYYAASVVLLYLIMPDSFDQTDIVQLFITLALVLLYSLSISVIALVFFSGFGHMIAEAVTTGKTSIKSFPAGIKRYFVKLLLTMLLLAAMLIGYAIVLGILLVPVTFILALSNMGTAVGAGSSMSSVTTVLTGLIAVAGVPFIVLWIPATFIENTGVIDALKKGFKTGTQNYGVLLLWTVVMYAPALIYSLVSLSGTPSTFGRDLFTPGYIIAMAITAALSIVYIPALFTLYDEKRKKTVKTQAAL